MRQLTHRASLTKHSNGIEIQVAPATAWGGRGYAVMTLRGTVKWRYDRSVAVGDLDCGEKAASRIPLNEAEENKPSAGSHTIGGPIRDAGSGLLIERLLSTWSAEGYVVLFFYLRRQRAGASTGEQRRR